MKPVLALSQIHADPAPPAAGLAAQLTAAPAACAYLLRLPAADGLGPQARRGLIAAVLLVHGLGGWALLQLEGVRKAVVEAAPIMVSLLAPVRAEEPTKPPPPPPPPRPELPKPVIKPAPLLAAATTPAATDFVVAKPEPVEPLQVAATVAAVSPLPAPPVPMAEPPAAKKISPNALRYLAEPKMTVPLLSRRLGESGIVHLRIVVDAKGNLKEASIKKSSGFERLDKQALEDIRSARFVPHVENGQAMQVESLALLSYELER